MKILVSLLFCLFFACSSIPNRTIASEPAPPFPASIPKSKFDLSKLDSQIRSAADYLCKQQAKVQEFIGRAEDEEVKNNLVRESRFLKTVCNGDLYVGPTDPALDANWKFLVKFEIAEQGMYRLVQYYQSMDEEVPATFSGNLEELRNFSAIVMGDIVPKAYKKENNADFFTVRDKISAWVSAMTEWYMSRE